MLQCERLSSLSGLRIKIEKENKNVMKTNAIYLKRKERQRKENQGKQHHKYPKTFKNFEEMYIQKSLKEKVGSISV